MEAPRLETKRLVLRPFVDEDAGGLVREIFGDLEVMKTLPEDPRTKDEQLACALQYIEAYNSPWPRFGYGGWAVCSRTTEISPPGALLGFCGFELAQIDNEGPEFGYGIGQSHWGKGIATEVARAAIDWFFTNGNHSRCHACIFPWNKASGRILEKIGLKYSRDENLKDSVKKGIGLRPFYTLDSESYLKARGQS